MGTTPTIQSPLKISANTQLSWGGSITLPVGETAGKSSVTMSNTAIYRSNSRFLLFSANTIAASLVSNDTTGIKINCSDNGTLFVHHPVLNGGAAATFHFAVFAGPGTVLTLIKA